MLGLLLTLLPLVARVYTGDYRHLPLLPLNLAPRAPAPPTPAPLAPTSLAHAPTSPCPCPCPYFYLPLPLFPPYCHTQVSSVSSQNFVWTNVVLRWEGRNGCAELLAFIICARIEKIKYNITKSNMFPLSRDEVHTIEFQLVEYLITLQNSLSSPGVAWAFNELWRY